MLRQLSVFGDLFAYALRQRGQQLMDWHPESAGEGLDSFNRGIPLPALDPCELSLRDPCA